MIPKYIQLKDKLSEAIVSKKYPLFSKLPTELELCEEYKVSRATVRQALSLLESEGIIEKKWGSGNIVVGSIDISNSKTVALLIPSLQDAGYDALIEDLKSALYKTGYAVKVFESFNKLSLEREILSEITKDIYAGYIVKPAASALPSMNKDYFYKLLKWQQPLIFIGAPSTFIPGATVVSGDDYNCGYSCARHFINKGHKTIGAIFNSFDYPSIERFAGFSEAIRDAGLNLMEDAIFWKQSKNQGITNFIRATYGEVSAIVCDDEEIVEKVYDTAIRNNISIPNDLAIICCQDTVNSIQTPLTVTSMGLIKALGTELAEVFLKQKNDGSNASATIKYKLIIGETS